MMKPVSLFLSFLLAFLLLLCGCRSSRAPGLSQMISSRNGIVTAAHPLAVAAGTAMLEKGGNAVDAAVAAAFALAVVEPSMSGLGGRLQAIYCTPDGKVRGMDATTQSPIHYDTSRVKPGAYGYNTIGIPGVVAGLTKLLEIQGTLPLATVMAPAIRYAREGFSLLPGEARRQETAQDELRQFQGSRRYFLLGDTVARKAGEWWVQPDLARTLETIAREGRKGFYEGEIARRMVADMEANGGLLTLEDLANYEVKESKIVSGAYRGYGLHGLWLPSFGAITIEILQILEHIPAEKLQGADWASAVYQATALAFEDRQKQYLADSMAVVLTSVERARELAAKIDLKKAGSAPSSYRGNVPEGWTAALGHTTHLSVIDAQGMAVALTQSLGPNLGSKVATPGLGFLYAVSLGSYLGIYEPGQRVSSHISPFLVMHKDKPYLVLGAAGSAAIVPAVAQVVSRVIDHKLPLDRALAAPRVFFERSEVLLETQTGYGWSPQEVQALKNAGLLVKEVPEPGRFGRVHAVFHIGKGKKWTGAADPDWEGAAGKPGGEVERERR